MSLYFILLLGSVAVPLALSFDKRLQFYRRWGYIFPAILLVAAVYIAFDVYLTKLEVWGFNPRYLSGLFLLHLPVEEWLFFIIIAYASMFLHFSVIEYFPKAKVGDKWTKILIVSLFLFSVAMIIVFHSKMYTVYIFGKLALATLLAFFDKTKVISSFFVTFLVILIPFTIVNGILTGSFIGNEVVWYNNSENLGIRFFTIPVEDFAYAFSMIFFNLLLAEKFKTVFSK